MKLFTGICMLILLVFSTRCHSQSDYSLGVTLGSGVNIYRNTLSADKGHFGSHKPMSLSLAVRLSKNLDEENRLFTDLQLTRKKIEYEYLLNEPEIPFSNKETFGQKYDCLSLFVGYRRLFPVKESMLYVEGSIGADYNNNVMSYNEGSGESQDDLVGTVYFENIYNTNLGEKTYTISANIGLGFNFGHRNQYDIGISINIPVQKIQSKESSYQYLWNYRNKNYIHHLNYLGNIYYPGIRLTYYLF